MSANLQAKIFDENSYFIYTYEGGDVKEGKNSWLMARRKEGKDVAEITPGRLDSVEYANNDGRQYVVIIHAHGVSPAIQKNEQQSLYFRKEEKVKRKNYKDEKAVRIAETAAHENDRMTAEVFADHLIDKQEIPASIKELHFYACYTDKFPINASKKARGTWLQKFDCDWV